LLQIVGVAIEAIAAATSLRSFCLTCCDVAAAGAHSSQKATAACRPLFRLRAGLSDTAFRSRRMHCERSPVGTRERRAWLTLQVLRPGAAARLSALPPAAP
jgi:hypothetical protein